MRFTDELDQLRDELAGVERRILSGLLQYSSVAPPHEFQPTTRIARHVMGAIHSMNEKGVTRNLRTVHEELDGAVSAHELAEITDCSPLWPGAVSDLVAEHCELSARYQQALAALSRFESALRGTS